ncbi:hypothetical protein GJ629_12435, partial [Halapricum sp. CBA1109]|uniref:hypothetical protein n=1 Tax=Halapricum sp. CBA1109 TaxID=2668068 RepID=UPI0012FC1CD7
MYVTPFGRAFDRAAAARSDRTMRGAVGVAVVATGLALVGVVLSQASLGYDGPLGLLFGGLFPFALAAALAVCGVAVLASDLDSRSLGRIGLWWLVGSVAATGAAVGVVLFESSNGGQFTQPAVVVDGNTATGGLTGLVVGVLAARRLALLSERDRERRQLADERERLTLLNRIVRHDLGNDLQVIDAAGDRIERSGEADPETVDRLRRTTREAIDVTEQVRTFLLAMDGDDPGCHAVDLRRILETQVDIARSRHPEATVRVDGDLPPVSVLADELLSSVVHNLLSNAVAHHDGRYPTVELSVASTATPSGSGWPTTARASP